MRHFPMMSSETRDKLDAFTLDELLEAAEGATETTVHQDYPNISGRELALVRTKIQEARLWFTQAL